MNHKVKLHGVRKYTQDQPGVEDGKQKHHTGLPGARKSREDAKRNSKEKKQTTRNHREGYQKAKYSRKAQHPACPLVCPVLDPKCPNESVQQMRVRNRKKGKFQEKAKEKKANQLKEIDEKENLVCSADASKRLGWHRMDRLILANTERIFVADQGLGVELE